MKECKLRWSLKADEGAAALDLLHLGQGGVEKVSEVLGCM